MSPGVHFTCMGLLSMPAMGSLYIVSTPSSRILPSDTTSAVLECMICYKAFHGNEGMQEPEKSKVSPEEARKQAEEAMQRAKAKKQAILGLTKNFDCQKPASSHKVSAEGRTLPSDSYLDCF